MTERDKYSAVIFEDNYYWLRRYAELLEIDGHAVIRGASTFDEACNVIPKLEAEGVNLALVDSTLDDSPNFLSGETAGDRIVGLLREQAPTIRIIDISAQGSLTDADAKAPKSKAEQLPDVINSLRKLTR